MNTATLQGIGTLHERFGVAHWAHQVKRVAASDRPIQVMADN
jgi:hypothetical protein